MWTPARNFYINKRQKNWLKVNAGSTTACLKQTGQEMNGAIPSPKPPKFCLYASMGKLMLALF